MVGDIDPAKTKGQLSLKIYKQCRYVKWPEQYNNSLINSHLHVNCQAIQAKYSAKQNTACKQ